MKTLYLDIFSGISGDMFVGAMIDLGVDLKHLEAELAKLPIEGLHLHARRDVRGGIAGVKFDVHAGHHDHGHTHHHNQGHDHDHGHSHTHPHTHAQDRGHTHEHGHADGDEHGHNHGHSHEHDHGHTHDHTHDHEHGHEHPHQHDHGHAHDEERGFKEIRHLIASSTLSEWVKTRAVSVFRRIGEAEAKVHGVSLDAVHFHEVGAWDSIADIIGCCVALEALGKPRVLAAPVVEGHGWVRCAHGRFPVPTAATLEILGARGVALTQGDEPGELVTPTGAAILAEFAESFGPMRQLSARRIGYGLGTRENKTRPNVLRAILGETEELSAGSGFETDVVAVIETNLDDVSGEVLGDFVRTALEAGALDVFQIPLLMKKNRPGTLLTVLCERADVDRFASLMLTLTTAYGVRISESSRRKLRREVRSLTTPYGAVDVKLGWLGADLVQVSPEFESCRRLAESRGVAVRGIIDEVRALAAQAWASSAR